ncbi:hypothetical protein QBC33DRAFT_510050 [Phialemonium atrogriseum]|uniref:Uncharacterized protein n=1 Tax=Phialemonium atrogriseum TaxID=1093897 RepID=A0AAJ0C8Y3_9PEZI|nr:uncharacterized protein QBC33DRAFT_510050 [Phialemonium atrogriseum]KAK1772156.1 hypothetical protein QBC33DRAFT_510050 [Phialemonium atrogriseum]
MAPRVRSRRQRHAVETADHPTHLLLNTDEKNPTNDGDSTGHKPDETDLPQPAWTPGPEPYNPETFAAWGRKHYCEKFDAIYRGRQRVLRVMERNIDGRPLKPPRGMMDESWKQITFPDTGDSEINSPEPPDPWDRLEWRRTHWDWDDETYQYNKTFLREILIDKARTQHEDEEGDRKAREEWDTILKLRWTDPIEYELQKRHYNLRMKGMTQDQIDAQDREADENWRRQQEQPLLAGSAIINPQLTKEYIESVQRRLKHKTPDACSPSTGRAEGLQQQASPPRSATDPSRKTRGGRITKNASQSQNATPRRARKLARFKREAYDSPPQGHELRRSRRLVGESPEFDVLGGKEDATPAMPVPPVQPNPPSQLPPDAQKTSSPGPRSSRRAPKKATHAKAAKPQGVSKSRQAAGRLRRPTRRSEG